MASTVPSSVGSTWVITIAEISESAPFPNFSRPKILGSFSLRAHTDYVDNAVGLRFLKLPAEPKSANTVPAEIDLNQDCPTLIREDEEQNHVNTSELKNLLIWIARHQSLFEEKRPDFVMYRGMMTSLLGTPFETRDTWCLGAILKNGTIYLRQLDTAESLQNRKNFNSDPRLRRFGAWGHHFENFLMADDPDGDPDPSNPSQTEFNVMYFARLNQHSLLYCGELDGVWLKKDQGINPKENPERLAECDLVELKTTRQFPKGKMTYNYKRTNLRKWWCQAFPACITDIIIGYRNDDGYIRELEILPIRSAAKLGEGWSGTVCFNFLDKFLAEVKNIVRDSSIVYVFTFEPKKQFGTGVRIQVCAEKDSPLLLKNLI